MAKEVKKVLKSCNLKVKVVERSGQTLKESLMKSDPFRREKCEEDCALCKNVESNVDCKGRNVVYKINCKECGESSQGLYIGESSRSIGERFKEHWDLYSKNSEKSVIHQHMLDHHEGQHKAISVKIVKSFKNDAMMRQVSEAEHIRLQKPEMNRKDEWQNLRNIYQKARYSRTKED